jgi:hypothetical protein
VDDEEVLPGLWAALLVLASPVGVSTSDSELVDSRAAVSLRRWETAECATPPLVPGMVNDKSNKVSAHSAPERLESQLGFGIACLFLHFIPLE